MPVGTGIAAARRPAQRGREQPHLRQLPRRRRRSIEGILLAKTPEARALVGNTITGNAFGLGGADLNGRDLAYDGNGTDNCFAGNTGVQATMPADRLDVRAVPVRRRERVQPGRQDQLLRLDRRRPRSSGWIKHPHAARKPGFEPLEVYKP